MDKKDAVLTKVIAWGACVLLFLPVALTLLTSLVGSLSAGRFLMDYLMPAELFYLALAGAVLLLWAAIRLKRCRGWAIGEFSVMAAALALCQGAAVWTGLASGRSAAAGWRLALVLGLLALYETALISLCAVSVAVLIKLRKIKA